jgi:hypothetical protein
MFKALSPFFKTKVSKEKRDLVKRRQEMEKSEFTFDGWDLAFYVKKWHGQLDDGKAPWFNKSFSSGESSLLLSKIVNFVEI